MQVQRLFKLGMDRLIPDVVDWRELDGWHLNLGAGNKSIPGTVPLDLPDWNADLDSIPYPDESVGVIHAYHFLEHLCNPIRLLWEAQRVLKSGGVMNICVPYYNAQCMAQDLTHHHAFCEETWRNLFKNPYYKRHSNEPDQWQLKVGLNIIIGVVERNLCLLTQLIKE